MKAKIHPKYYDDCQVTCTCGNTFVTGSTLPEISVEICSACHPFYTGQSKYIDTEGRIDRFERRRKTASGKVGKRKKRLAKAKKKRETAAKKVKARKKTPVKKSKPKKKKPKAS